MKAGLWEIVMVEYSAHHWAYEMAERKGMTGADVMAVSLVEKMAYQTVAAMARRLVVWKAGYWENEMVDYSADSLVS